MLMEYVVTQTEMKTIDFQTIHNVGIPAMVLMEQAAMAVSNKMLRKINQKDSILAICGIGNNGGDGIAVARMLKHLGYMADVLVVGDESHGTKEFQQQLQIARNLGVNILNNAKISEYNIIIDAIFGIGLSRAVQGEYAAIIEEINNTDNIVYSVDIPSGIHADHGKVMNVAIRADVTVTFGLLKKGLLLYPGTEYVGELVKADIGFPDRVIESVMPKTFTYDLGDKKFLPPRNKNSNKGTYGRVLVIAGSEHMSGASYLSAKAAYRTGAGLVKILTHSNNRIILQTALPEAIVSTYEDDWYVGNSEIQMKKEIEWATVIVIGPGIGMTKTSEYLVNSVLQYATCPIVVDADALNIIARQWKDQNLTREQRFQFREQVILTPHVKEMSRLLDCQVGDICDNLPEVIEDVMKQKNCILAIKDARTVVSDGTKVYLNTSGNQGMSTGGSGDVLTGIIAGLLAHGTAPFKATCLGVYIHGLAGDYAKQEKGTYSLIAGDIIDALSQVLK